MKHLFALVVCLCCVWEVQSKSPCCVPDQWEALAGGENASVIHGRASVIDFSIPRLSVDFKANKLAVQEVVSTGQWSQNVTSIVDYNAGVVWVITDVKAKHCMKIPLPSGTKPDRCIPPTWSHVATLNMGFGDNVVAVDNYVTPAGSPVLGSVLVTSDTCVPVTEYFRQGGDSPMVISMLLFNVTPGIKDPSVFDVPSFCKHSNLVWNPDAIIPQELPHLSQASKLWIKKFTGL